MTISFHDSCFHSRCSQWVQYTLNEKFMDNDAKKLHVTARTEPFSPTQLKTPSIRLELFKGAVPNVYTGRPTNSAGPSTAVLPPLPVHNVSSIVKEAIQAILLHSRVCVLHSKLGGTPLKCLLQLTNMIVQSLYLIRQSAIKKTNFRNI